jgi:hypothetical protein
MSGWPGSFGASGSPAPRCSVCGRAGWRASARAIRWAAGSGPSVGSGWPSTPGCVGPSQELHSSTTFWVGLAE